MDSPGPGPTDAFAEFTYAGESVIDAVSVSGGTVGVTTHRVLALTPGDPGPNLSAVDRPNVDSVTVASAGDVGHGVRALRFGVYALALFGGSFLVDFDSMSAIDPPAAAGAGQVVSLAVQLTGLLAIVDDVLMMAGVIVLLVGLGFAAMYAHSRDRHLAIGVAGGDPVRVPVLQNEPVAVDRIRVALEKASNPSDG